MSEPERPRRRDFEDNRTRILEAARHLIAERGPEALSISEVVRRADLNRTTAYKHFRTRDELVGAVMEALADEVGEMLTQPMAFGERVDHMARFFAEHP
ncbi:MAG: helix-turn-helix transcriptional regulator, partial [Myxococcales bacterium]|nr:helix-turn-helix transcriptional regulator [Myxococcales bacterium]